MKELALSLTALITALFIASPALAEAAAVSRLPGSAAPASAVQTKKEIIGRLRALQDQQVASLAEIDKAIRKELQETLSMNVKSDDLTVASRRTNLVTKKIDELNKRRDELNARRDIVDRLIFQIDSKWNGQKMQTFLEQTFIEMASADLADGRDSHLWKAFTYLSMVMREVPEPNEDAISVFEGYMNASNVLDPKTPAEFLATRNYTDGKDNAVAKPVAKDSAGDFIHDLPAAQHDDIPVAKLNAQAHNEEPPKTEIVLIPPKATPADAATAPPTPIKEARDRALSNPPNTISGTSQSARELTAPASESQLR